MALVLQRVLAHSSRILAIVFATFIALDWFNPYMSFVSNDTSTPLLAVFCCTSVATATQLLHVSAGSERAPHSRS